MIGQKISTKKYFGGIEQVREAQFSRKKKDIKGRFFPRKWLTKILDYEQLAVERK